MFHSSANKELELFTRWRSDFEGLEIKLVKGNHDILNRKWYEQSRIELFDSTLKISAFCFQHDPGECGKDDDGKNHYVFSGHIHPGITIHGSGKQSLKFPCFYFTDTYCILPAFSRFTGTVGDSGEGRWTVAAAIDEEVAADVLTTALFRRFRSRRDHTFADKLLSALRAQFGGHTEHPK